MRFKVEGKLQIIHKFGQPDCIRDARGILLKFPRITKWTGQEERYVNEIQETYDLANRIIQALKSIPHD